MNPATADLVKAVEAVPSDEVVILPNNKNIRPVAEQVDSLSGKQVRVVATGSIVEGFAALLAYDPAAAVDANVASMTESAARVVPAEVTRAVRDAVTDAGEVHEGDYIGISRDGVVAIADNPVVCTRLLLSRLLDESHELVTLIEGEGATRRGHAADRGVALRGVSRRRRSRCTTAASPSTRTCWGLSNGRTLGDLSARPVSVLRSVSERKAARLAELGVESVLDLVTTYPRRYIDRTRQADVSGPGGGRRGRRAGVGAVGAVAAGPERARGRRADGPRRHRPPGRRLLQPALAGQAARGGHRGDLLRQGRRVPGRAPDGQSGGRRRGGGDPGPAHAADPARVPGVGQGRAD